MKVEEIEQQSLALPEGERASLVAKLLHTLPPAAATVPDSEIEQRESDLASGKVSAISHDEFVRRVQSERGR
jgi:hypothetical protein